MRIINKFFSRKFLVLVIAVLLYMFYGFPYELVFALMLYYMGVNVIQKYFIEETKKNENQN